MAKRAKSARETNETIDGWMTVLELEARESDREMQNTKPGTSLAAARSEPSTSFLICMEGRPTRSSWQITEPTRSGSSYNIGKERPRP